MENMDFLPPIVPSLVFARESYTPYCLRSMNYGWISSISKAPWGGSTLTSNLDSIEKQATAFSVEYEARRVS